MVHNIDALRQTVADAVGADELSVEIIDALVGDIVDADHCRNAGGGIVKNGSLSLNGGGGAEEAAVGLYLHALRSARLHECSIGSFVGVIGNSVARDETSVFIYVAREAEVAVMHRLYGSVDGFLVEAGERRPVSVGDEHIGMIGHNAVGVVEMQDAVGL